MKTSRPVDNYVDNQRLSRLKDLYDSVKEVSITNFREAIERLKDRILGYFQGPKGSETANNPPVVNAAELEKT